jgi:glycosyltransferase 2 family protein
VSKSRRVRLGVIALIGIAVAFYVLRSIGVTPILSAATAVGWRGFGILCLYQFGQFLLLGTAWYVLIPRSYGARAPVFIWARMVRDATTELLPFSHLGGIVCGVRAAIGQGVAQPVAYGSVVTDITTEMVAQIAFTAVGVGILMTSTSIASMSLPVAGSAVLGLVTIVATCAAFVAFQRYGRQWPAKVIARLFPHAVPLTDRAIACIQEIYRRPADVSLAVLLHCGGWIASAFSTWIALRFMGVQAGVVPVLAIESLVCALRSVAFWVPNGLGVQEVACATIAPLFGIGAEIGFAISVLKRTRDIAVGVPILLLWQWMESRRFLAFAPVHQQGNGECGTPL